jgi:hypothetical protein
MTRIRQNAQVCIRWSPASPAAVWLRRILMKQLILAAVAVLSLGIGSAYAQSFAHEAPSQGSGQGYRQ